MNRIDIRDIVEITDDKIIYRGKNGVGSIELAPCAANFEAEFRNSAASGTCRCVAVRFFGEYNSYYELFDEEHTRLFLKMKTNKVKRLLFKLFYLNFHVKEFQLFYSVHKQLNAHGWTTLDLT